MKYKLLGSSGLRVSELCLGTMTFSDGTDNNAGPAEARRIYEIYRAAGGNFIDTANIYTGGNSERALAPLIAPERDSIVLATKYSMTMNPADPNASGNQRKNLAQSIEQSLVRLGTGYVDLLWVHGWDQMTRVDEVMRGLEDLVRAGKVLHIGSSNCPAWWVSQANTLAAERNMTPFTALQLHYNLVERSIEADFFALAHAQDMTITAWSPLAGGLLTGKYNADSTADGRLNQVSYGAGLLAEHRLKIASGLAGLADKIGCEPAALALAWLLHRPYGTVIPILGARTVDQFERNMACLEVTLSPEQVAKLDSLNEPPPVYPASLFKSEFFSQMIAGEKGRLES